MQAIAKTKNIGINTCTFTLLKCLVIVWFYEVTNAHNNPSKQPIIEIEVDVSTTEFLS